jgi:hypothetical protein
MRSLKPNPSEGIVIAMNAECFAITAEHSREMIPYQSFSDSLSTRGSKQYMKDEKSTYITNLGKV